MANTPSRPWEHLPIKGPILRPAQAAAYVGLSLGHYYRLIKEGHIPPFIKLGSKSSGVPQSHLDAFLESRATGQRSRSEVDWGKPEGDEPW